MQKILLLIVSIIFVFCSCKRTKGDSVLPKDYVVTIDRIQAQRAWIEVFPPSEQIRYSLDILPVEDYEEHFSGLEGEKIYAEMMDSMRQEDGEVFGMMYQGAFFGACTMREATAYYLVLTGYSNNRPVLPVRKERFETLKRVKSDLYIVDITPDSLGLVVTPSNDEDTYFWDVAPMSEIRFTSGIPSFYFYDLLEDLYYYEFTQEMVVSGPSQIYASDYDSPMEESSDTLVVMFVGYDGRTGETTDAYEMWWVITQSHDAPIIRRADPDGFEDLFMPTYFAPTRKLYLSINRFRFRSRLNHDSHRRYKKAHR